MPANFITVAFLYFFFHHPDSLVCLSEERDLMCTGEYKPVCALYTGDDCNSPTGYCLKTMSSSCSACADSTVVGHIINGECTWEPFQVCSAEHSENSCAATEIEGTVCGITEKAGTGSTTANPAITKTLFDNGCQACNEGQSTFYLGGEAFGQCLAISTSNICSPGQRNAQDCEPDYLKSCGYYSGGDCTEKICRRTYESHCFACADEDVLFWQNGDCSEVVPIGEGGSEPVFEHDGGDGEIIPEEEQEEERPRKVIKKRKTAKKGKKVVKSNKKGKKSTKL